MTARAMGRGRSILAHEGITPDIASRYKNDMKLQKNLLQGMEDAQRNGRDSRGMYAVHYFDPIAKTHQTSYVSQADFAKKLTLQRTNAAKAESAYNDMKAEQQKYGQTVGYREEQRGRKHPYTSARRQRRNAANHTSTMADNWHDNTAEDFNRDNGLDPTIGNTL